MRALICYDDDQLRRIESSIAAIEAAPSCYRQSKQVLLDALQTERAALLQYTKHRRARTNRAAAMTPKRLRWLDAPPPHLSAA